MRKSKLQILPIPTWLAIVSSILVWGLWIPTFLKAMVWIIPAGAALMTIINAFLIMLLFYEVGITRTFSAIPVLFYFITIGAIPPLHTALFPHFTTTITLFLLYWLIRTKGKEAPIQPVFGCTLLCLLTAWLCHDTIILLPLIWLSFFILKGFSLRAMSASFIAIALVAIYFCLYWWWTIGTVPHFIDFGVLFSRKWIGTDMIGWLTMGMGIFAIFSIACNVAIYTFENTTTIRFLNLLIAPILLILVSCLFPCETAEPPLSILLALISISMTAYALLRPTNIRGICLIVYLLGLLAFWFIYSFDITSLL